MRAGVETEEQLRACIDAPELSLIYIDTGYFAPEMWREKAEAVRKSGKLCAARFPHIFRKEADRLFTENIEELSAFDAFLLRSFEELGFIYERLHKEGRHIPPLIFDHSMYSFNLEALRAAAGLGADTITLPLELNMRELKYLCSKYRIYKEKKEAETKQAPGIELTVYGRIPMMVTAQCVKKTKAGCDKKPCVLYLKDRKNELMPVKNCCSFCYNTVLNSKPTVIYDMKDEIEELAPDFMRLEFTVEDYKDTARIISEAAKIWSSTGKDIEKRSGRAGDFTRGHFKRGVE